ncbi:C40 family peptidase [Paenibacillus cymbidii]|uniref:C40 family peptidase n=1 Tax=Paenibacillus cymbidii TaxID=1639034 RepID=UPI0010819390|nr:SH3 domain-containing C40 family peptidase [Paenibacillus cymbidii]
MKNKKLMLMAASAVLSLTIATNAFAASGTVDRSVNFRTAPNTDSSVISTLKSGTSFTVLSKVNDYWLKVSVGGKTGYVSTGYVSTGGTSSGGSGNSGSSQSSKADQVIAKALSLKGITHYKYGVNQAPTLLDCSSYVKYVYSFFGVNLKWGTRYQKDAGTFVAKANLKKGDLVFLRVGSSKEIGHVGIYAGNGQFIHNSPSEDGVMTSSLTSGYWASRYVTARRVL